MYNNSIDIDFFKKKVNQFSLSEKLLQSQYSNLFYDHLTGMLKFQMVGEINNIDTLKLNERTYFGLEQYIFEHPEEIEKEPSKNEIDWDGIDILIDELKIKIDKLLGKESKSETLKPIIDFTINVFENSLMYQNLYPKSLSNPWIPTDNIVLKNGYLLLVSDKRDLVQSFDKKILDKADENSSNLFVIAASHKKNSFSGFQIDNRSSLQGLVYEFLKREGRGYTKAKKIKDIRVFLKDQRRNNSEQNIKVKILLPLKREGLIGSTTSGYFYIDNQSDLQQSYSHLQEKISGIQKSINMYSLKAEQMGWHLN